MAGSVLGEKFDVQIVLAFRLEDPDSILSSPPKCSSLGPGPDPINLIN